MIRPTTNSRESQQIRLESKTQETQLMNRVVEGTGMSPWEAEVLVEIVREIYFSNPADQPLHSGQIRYDCVASHEGAGKPIRDCQMVSVVLTLVEQEDSQIVSQFSVKALRQLRLQRMTEEAREQGGLLSQEDLSLLLGCDVRTIRRDVRELKDNHNIYVATRGQQKDIGPGVTHKGVALHLWLEGKEPVEIAREIHHSLGSVERYIQHFSRVVFLHKKKFAAHQIMLTVGLSSACVTQYLELYEACRRKRGYRQRFQDLEVIGLNHYQAQDAKKGAPLPGMNTKNEWR